MQPTYVLFYCKYFTTRVHIDPTKKLSPIELYNDERISEEKRVFLMERFQNLDFLLVSSWDGIDSLDGYYIGIHKVPKESLSPWDIVRASGANISFENAEKLLENYRYRKSQPLLTNENEGSNSNVFSFKSNVLPFR